MKDNEERSYMLSCNSSFYTEVLLQDLENISGTDRIIKLISPTVLKLQKSFGLDCRRLSAVCSYNVDLS